MKTNYKTLACMSLCLLAVVGSLLVAAAQSAREPEIVMLSLHSAGQSDAAAYAAVMPHPAVAAMAGAVATTSIARSEGGGGHKVGVLSYPAVMPCSAAWITGDRAVNAESGHNAIPTASAGWNLSRTALSCVRHESTDNLSGHAALTAGRMATQPAAA